MKKIVYIILFTLIFTFTNNVFGTEIEYNTELNVKKAVLVEDYISRHKNKIDIFMKKYNIFNNKTILNNIAELNESITALKKIQNTDIKKEVAGEVIQAVLNRIKKTNESLKIQLKIEKDIFEKNLKSKKDSFSKLGLKIATKINSINIIIAKKIFNNKDSLSNNELLLKQNLIKLNKESLKLKTFGNITFSSEIEIKNTFVEILEKIKNEINSMKINLNKKD